MDLYDYTAVEPLRVLRVAIVGARSKVLSTAAAVCFVVAGYLPAMAVRERDDGDAIWSGWRALAKAITAIPLGWWPKELTPEATFGMEHTSTVAWLLAIFSTVINFSLIFSFFSVFFSKEIDREIVAAASAVYAVAFLIVLLLASIEVAPDHHDWQTSGDWGETWGEIRAIGPGFLLWIVAHVFALASSTVGLWRTSKRRSLLLAAASLVALSTFAAANHVHPHFRVHLAVE